MEISILKVNKVHFILCKLLLRPINFFFPKLFMNKLLLQEFLFGSFRFLSFIRINTPFVPVHSECVVYYRMNIVGIDPCGAKSSLFLSEYIFQISSMPLILEVMKYILEEKNLF